jgi:hypothetical protein
VVEAAGYSGTPLPTKLGIKPGSRVLLMGAPERFAEDTLGLLPDVEVHRRAGRSAYDVVLAFAPDLRALQQRFEPARSRLTTTGGLWVAWPKRSSGLATDLDDNLVREFGLATGLVDNKVCAIDATWSGLRFVVRLADR